MASHWEMDLENLAKTWDSFGKNDPLGAVLSLDEKKGSQWGPDEFFGSGEAEVELSLSLSDEVKVLEQKKRSIDFGCGVGRLTFALATRFEESHGVGISEEMIAKANHFKEQRMVENSYCHLNKEVDLGLFESDSFDFILWLIGLQHMEPRYVLVYIKEFVRLIKAGGLAVFQLPEAGEYRANYSEFTKSKEPMMEVFGMDKSKVVEVIESAGGKVLEVAEDPSFGDVMASYEYDVTK